jgi:hypothetical protein
VFNTSRNNYLREVLSVQFLTLIISHLYKLKDIWALLPVVYIVSSHPPNRGIASRCCETHKCFLPLTEHSFYKVIMDLGFALSAYTWLGLCAASTKSKATLALKGLTVCSGRLLST